MPEKRGKRQKIPELVPNFIRSFHFFNHILSPELTWLRAAVVGAAGGFAGRRGMKRRPWEPAERPTIATVSASIARAKRNLRQPTSSQSLDMIVIVITLVEKESFTYDYPP